MRRSSRLCSILICLGAIGWCIPLDARGAGPSTALLSDEQITEDAGTDLVTRFYRVLLQEEPPTAEQEKQIFVPKSALRSSIAISQMGLQEPPYTEPMLRSQPEREKWREFSARIAEAGPLVLNHFRAHKEKFLPKHMTRTTSIQISTSFRLLRDLEKVHAEDKGSYVLVFFINDAKAPPGEMRFRTIIFSIEHGKIDPDAIYMDGFEGATSLEMFSGENRIK